MSPDDLADAMWGPGGACDRLHPGQQRAIIGGTCYVIGVETSKGPRGFGGRRFDIEFFDGRTVTTTDLWYQGVVSPKWRERLPDNARFATSAGEA